MLHNLIQKGLAYGLLLLFIGTTVIGMYDGTTLYRLAPKDREITLYVGGGGSGNYTNIQDAIDDANDGDTIFVYPGTYHENQIMIGKNISVTGEDRSTTIIDGNNAALDDCGLIRIIALGDVTFTGFTIQDPGSTIDGNRMGIYAASDREDSTYIISHNMILGTNNPDDEGDYGFYSNSGKETLIFTYNTMTQHGSNPILLEKHTGETDVSYNTLDEGAYGSVVYFSMTYDNQNITTLQKISHNDINLGTGEHTGSDYYGGGIVFRSAFTGTPGKYMNVEISENTIHNMKGCRRAISLSNDATDSGVDSEIVAPRITENTIIGSDEAGSIGIQLRGLVTDTLIEDNSIFHCEKSFFGTGGVSSPGIYPSNTLVNYNNLKDNILGFIWNGTTELNAEQNWWGDASGPSSTGNPGGLGDNVSDNVDYFPWLLHQCGPPYAEYCYTITDRTVFFNASSSGDYDGIITDYVWDFGDQTTGQGKNCNHEYSSYGTYTVKLTVTDDDESTDTIQKNVTLIDFIPPVISNIHDSPDPQHSGGHVNISCIVTDNVAVSRVHLIITPPTGPQQNLTMNYRPSTNLAYVNTTFTINGIYSYYIWAQDLNGNALSSSTYTFTIINNPPNNPSNPNPTNGQTSVSINTDLSWTGSDPDSGDTVTYDVFFGNVSPPPKVTSNQSTLTYDPGTLSFSTTYYWKIIAWDNHQAHTNGLTWSFSTNINARPNAPTINGPASGTIGKSYNYTFVAIDPEQNDVSYEIDWGDGHVDSWFGPFPSNTVVAKSHTWTDSGSFLIKARAKDIYGAIGSWGSLTIRMPTEIPGQSTQSQQITQSTQHTQLLIQ
jgi:hypothetical protein